MSIGARSQSAKTYLEKHLPSFAAASPDELVRHGLLALRDTLQADAELTAKNCAVAIVGKDHPFTSLTEEQLPRYLAMLEGVRRSNAPPPAAASAAPAPTPAAAAAAAAGTEAMATDAGAAGAAGNGEPPQRSDMDL
jgi:20S proteasome subunit alpha 6